MIWRGRSALGLVLAGAVLSALPSIGWSSTGSGRDVVSEAEHFIEERIEQVRTLDRSAQGRRVRETLDELEFRLEEGGIDGPLARALSAYGPAHEDDTADDGLPELRAARQRLRRYAEATRRDAPDAYPRARERLEEILAAPAFQVDAPRVTRLQRLAIRFRERLLDLFSWVAQIVGRNPTLAVVALIALVLGSLGGCLWMVVRWHRRTGIGGPGSTGIELGRSQIAPEPGAWIERGRAELEAGHLKPALKALETAAWLALRQAGLLPPTPGLTNLEGRRMLAAESGTDLPATFDRLLEIHERGVFAGHPVSDDDVRRAIGLAERLVRRSARLPAP